MGAAQMQATRAHVTSTSLLTTLTLPRFWPPFYENTLISPLGYILPSMISLLKLQYFLYLNVCFFIGDAKNQNIDTCDPMDCSLQGSSVHGVFQARVLEWGAIAFSEISHDTI